MSLSSWVPGADASPYNASCLPYGVADGSVVVRIGDHVLFLDGVFGGGVFASASLNAFMASGPHEWRDARERIQRLLTDERFRGAAEPHLKPLSEVTLGMPFEVADYVDFYCSLEHASNLGRMFRPDEEPLKPNWRHLPVGYHGRSGTVVPSGTPVRRPSGQRGAGDFGPSRKLDIEVELGFVVGVPAEGPVRTSDFASHVFGVTLVNDWSARDIQAWEYVPLGPFLGKSFATSVSPWVVPLDALSAARVPGRGQDPAPLPYLERAEPWGLDLGFEVELNGEVVSRPPYAGMYWTPDQMLAHMTVNGATIRTGDLYASGTVSGEDAAQRGSFIELTWNGADPVKLSDGSVRAFLEDGDTVTITATGPGADGVPIALGEVSGTITPA
ncbi:fumarylacetoacetase [Bailinhaonella thermotolerans]|uniref:fumarylacetoacetase n=1 Tax=Bailinhaonella thermotolerans TaxID=1070861 RepID=A0A3A4B0R2_9ACTN|nr:fumarylacetoacetase [Bailinhaonella thermotolerans]